MGRAKPCRFRPGQTNVPPAISAANGTASCHGRIPAWRSGPTFTTDSAKNLHRQIWQNLCKQKRADREISKSSQSDLSKVPTDPDQNSRFGPLQIPSARGANLQVRSAGMDQKSSPDGRDWTPKRLSTGLVIVPHFLGFLFHPLHLRRISKDAVTKAALNPVLFFWWSAPMA